MRAALLFLACLLWSGAAMAAGDVRFPETGVPAFVFSIPDEWVTATDNDGNMEVAPRIRNVVMVLFMGPDSSSLDAFAAGMLKAAGADAATRREATTLGGRQGTIYYSAMDNPSDPSGLRVNIRLTLVRPDAGTIASCALLINGSATEADIAASQAVANGITFVH